MILNGGLRTAFVVLLIIGSSAWLRAPPVYGARAQLGRYFGLTCHPECIGRVSRLRMLERLLEEARDKGDVWFPTGKELSDWVREKLT